MDEGAYPYPLDHFQGWEGLNSRVFARSRAPQPDPPRGKRGSRAKSIGFRNLCHFTLKESSIDDLLRDE